MGDLERAQPGGVLHSGSGIGDRDLGGNRCGVFAWPPALSEPWREWLPEQREAFLENAGETMIECGLATEAELRASLESIDGGTGNGAGSTARRGAAT
jgi:hypothetical protein